MAKIYAALIRKGIKTLDEVPARLRNTVEALLAENGWADIECRKDYGGNDRCIIARRPQIKLEK